MYAVVAAEQRVLEGNVHAAIAVLDIEHHGVAAHFAPAADDPYSVVTGRHESGEVHGPHFKIRGTGTDFSTIGMGSSPGMITGWPAFRKVPLKSPLALRIASLSSAGGQIRSLRQIMPGHQRDAVAALGDIKCAARRRHRRSGTAPGPWAPSGVDGREVRNNLGFAVWAEAGETAAGRPNLKK